jgi:hypothetical protein
MDTTALAQAAQEIAAAARVAYDAELDDPRWSGLSGRILEDASNVADYFKRTMHGYPDDPYYVRMRSGDLVDAAATLHQRVMESALHCRHLIIEQKTDPDDGHVWTTHHHCERERGHAGEHDHRNNTRQQMLEAANKLEWEVTRLASRIRWTMLSGDKAAVDEAFDDIERDLRDLGGELRHRVAKFREAPGVVTTRAW